MTPTEKLMSFSAPKKLQSPSLNLPKTDWSDEETLLLLEGIKQFGENWDAISQKVKTKTKDQCLLHFLQLPIEDQLLVSIGDASKPIQEQPLPFADSSNPVMALIAFLASAVQPAVGAAAAEAALSLYLHFTLTICNNLFF